MREIKFRAWDKRTNSWRSGSVLDKFERLAILNSSDFFIDQFTGLKDRNGTEIYEGDIFGQLWQLRCVVERMEDGAYKLVFLDKRIAPWSIIDSRVSKSDIIGNIHENKDLLKPEGQGG